MPSNALVAAMACLTDGHLPVGPLARRARLRLAPALPASRLSVSCAPPAAAYGVAGHAGGDAFCAVVFAKVDAPTGDQFQVVRVVVEAVPVFVVDDFDGRQSSAQSRLHDQPVLHHPTALRGVRVIRAVHHPVRPSPESSHLRRADDHAPVVLAALAHADSVDKGARCSKQKNEWLTLSHPPAWTPEQQIGLFA